MIVVASLRFYPENVTSVSTAGVDIHSGGRRWKECEFAAYLVENSHLAVHRN